MLTPDPAGEGMAVADELSLGERIREARKARGLTQDLVGQQVGVTPQAVSKWENGESAPDIATLRRLCTALGIAADDLLQIRSAEQGAIDPLLRGFREWRALSGDQRTMLDLEETVPKLVSLLRDAGWASAGDVVTVQVRAGRLAGATLVTPHGSIVHWAGAADLPANEVSDEAIASALRDLSDPELIGALRRLAVDGMAGFAPRRDAGTGTRPDPTFERLLREGFVSYDSDWVDGEQISPHPAPTLAATTILMLAAVVGLGRRQAPRGGGLTSVICHPTGAESGHGHTGAAAADPPGTTVRV
jgi:transcriptional regulator with XRE-family HTH domain